MTSSGSDVVISGKTVAASDVAKVLGDNKNWFGRTAAQIRISVQVGEWVSQKSLSNRVNSCSNEDVLKICAAYKRAIEPQEQTKEIKGLLERDTYLRTSVAHTMQGLTPEQRTKFFKSNWDRYASELMRSKERRAVLWTLPAVDVTSHAELTNWSDFCSQFKDQGLLATGNVPKDTRMIRFETRGTDYRKEVRKVWLSFDGTKIYDVNNPKGLLISSPEGGALYEKHEKDIYDHMHHLVKD